MGEEETFEEETQLAHGTAADCHCSLEQAVVDTLGLTFV